MASITSLNKMLINYFGNSKMLRIYKKRLKSHDRKDLLSSKFQINVKRDIRRSWKILEGQLQKFIG